MEIQEYKEVLRALKEIISGTKWENHVFAVGGCVRDSLMNYPIKDIDLVVDLSNGGIDFAVWLCDKNLITREPITYPTYGTAMFKLVEFPELELEVVETRKEQYKDKESRNPDVVYGTLAEDCVRRDLTINAMYYDITNEKVVDLVGGQEDIANKIIRTPSDPDIVFNDDPLRILRVCRFSTKYNWPISKETVNGIKHNAKRLKIITQERITDEITKTLVGAMYAGEAWYCWRKNGLLKYILPEINQDKLYCDNIEKHLDLLSDVDKTPELYFAAILKDNLEVLKRMKLSNEFICLVEKMVNSLQWIYADLNDASVRRFGKMYGKDYHLCFTFVKTLVMSVFGSLDFHMKMYEFEHMIDRLEKDGTMFNEKTVLPIDGYDIMSEYDMKPSKKVKEMLDAAWEIYYNEPNISKRELLDNLANKTK